MRLGSEFNQLKNWRNPVLSIRDPKHQRWAEISQTMDTHINGVCPLHIYVNRRPLESNNSYALEYRVNNFQPLTKEAFDRSIAGIIENISTANIQIKTHDVITQNTFKIRGKEVFEFCFSDLIRLHETDPNAVIVVLPKVEDVDDFSVSINDVSIMLIPSSDIVYIDEFEIKFKVEKNKDGEFIYTIKDGNYSIEHIDTNGKSQHYQIVSLSARKPYITISDNIVYEGKYKIRLPYLFGAAAWGDKFYGQESDFSVQATRFTYLKEIRAKERCDEAGMIYLDGVHCGTDVNDRCKKCGGSGYVKDDSPLGTIYVDYSKLNAEERSFPQVIQWAEPPQTALTSSKEITDTYYERMCESLGLLKQNFTNQSGVSRQFDYKEKLSVIYKIAQNNIKVCEDIYRFIEYFLVDEAEQMTTVYLVGEIGYSSINDLLAKLSESKTNQSPPSIISAIIDQIYAKSLPPDYSDLIIDIAKFYDKLYIYGSNEITIARAQLGAAVTERDVIIHNTIIDVLTNFFNKEGLVDKELAIKHLDDYYLRYAPKLPTASTIGLL